MRRQEYFDRDALNKFRALGGEDLVAEMIDRFSEVTRQHLNLAAIALQDGNLTGIEQAACVIKLSALLVGAGRVRQIAGEIEAGAASNEIAEIPSLLRRLSMAYKRMKIGED